MRQNTGLSSSQMVDVCFVVRRAAAKSGGWVVILPEVCCGGLSDVPCLKQKTVQGKNKGGWGKRKGDVSKQSYEEKKVSSETEEKKRHWITLRIKLERQLKRKRRKRNKQVLGMGMGLGVEIQTEVPVRTSIGGRYGISENNTVRLRGTW